MNYNANDILLGFDVGGTKVAVCLGTASGELIASERVDNFNRKSEDTVPEIIVTAQNLLKKHHLTPRAVGISAPGPLDVAAGVITTPVNMPYWRHVPLRALLAEAFGVEAFFENDANAAALAEWLFGAAKGCRDMIYITMSTGIGGGIVANGRLVGGVTGDAGELGHMILDINGPYCSCGQRGCYEAYCGGRTVAMRAQEYLRTHPENPLAQIAGGVEKIDMRAIIQGVREKIPYALEIWDEMALRNAQAIGGLINTFAPEKIVMGTFALVAGDLFMDPIRHYLPRFAWPAMLERCTLEASSLGVKIGEYSGIAAALNGLMFTASEIGN